MENKEKENKGNIFLQISKNAKLSMASSIGHVYLILLFLIIVISGLANFDIPQNVLTIGMNNSGIILTGIFSYKAGQQQAQLSNNSDKNNPVNQNVCPTCGKPL